MRTGIFDRGDIVRVRLHPTEGIETQGVVLVNGTRMMDLAARQAQKVEKAPESIVKEVLAVLSAIIE